jgi:membrane protein YqaA with SNARE-associated domain
MRPFFYSFLGYFLTPGGLVLMGALDSSLIFFLPLGIDFVVVLLVARHPELFWLYTLLATVGSIVGAGGTYWLGRKIGEHGLSRLIHGARLRRIQHRVSQGAAVTIAALAIIPPPFPFTAFILTSGALKVDPWRFFLTLTGVRLVRFGAESALAMRYGHGILAWTKTTTLEVVIGVLFVLAVIGTVLSAVAAARGPRVPTKRAA